MKEKIKNKLKKVTLTQLEMIKMILIGILAIIIIVFSINVTNKINDLEYKINHARIINGMLYQDFEQRQEYEEENGLDDGMINFN